ncbi:MAG TPA: hypothetical protein PLV92_18500, partial [Pirellulaceae bacterium]|nr:hypothetical protein [Pirellulaceae bacterium]
GRLRRVKQVVALLLGVLIVGGIGTSIQIYTLYKTAESARGEAEKNRKTAEKNAETALRREKDATDARGAELKQRVRAEVLGVEARRAQAEVQEKSYFGEIALANEEIDANAFEKARELLDDHTKSVQAKYLHWEWGRLRFLCRVTGDKSVRTSAAQDWPVETLAVADRSSPPRVVLAGRDGQIALFNLDTNESLPPPVDWQTRRLASITSLAFTPDQRWLAIAGSSVDSAGRQAGRVQVWRVEGSGLTFAAETSSPLGRQVRCIATAADSQRLVLGSDDHAVRIWRWPIERSNADTEERSELPLVGAHLAPVTCVAIAGDLRRVASGGEDGTVRVWRAPADNAEKTAATTGPGELARFRGHKGSVFAVAFSPNGKLVASGGFDRRLLVWEAPGADAKLAPIVKDIRSRLRGPSAGVGSRTSDDARGDVGAEPSSREAKVAELPGQPAAVRCLAFDGAGKVLLSAGQDNVARIWRLDNLEFQGADGLANENAGVDDRRPIKELRGHGSWVTAAYLSADGRTVVTGSYDRTWRWWDVDGYSEYRFLPAGTAQLPSEPRSRVLDEPPGDDDVQFVSKDVVAAGVASRDATLTSPAQDPRVTRMRSDGRPVLSARYLPDGERIVTASEDGVVSFWNIGANKPDATVS